MKGKCRWPRYLLAAWITTSRKLSTSMKLITSRWPRKSPRISPRGNLMHSSKVPAGTPIRIPLYLALSCFSPGAIYLAGRAYSRNDLRKMLKAHGVTRTKVLDKISTGQYRILKHMDVDVA
jgi:hypothetical protein